MVVNALFAIAIKDLKICFSNANLLFKKSAICFSAIGSKKRKKEAND